MVNRNVSAVSAVAACLLLGFCIPTRASVVASGRVLNAETRQPVGGATLSVFASEPPAPPARFQAPPKEPTPLETTQALSNGTFVFRLTGAGSYWIRVSMATQADDYRPYTQPFKITATSGPLEVLLAPLPALHLRLLDANGKPISDRVDVWEWILWGDHKSAFKSLNRTAAADGALSLPVPKEVDTKTITHALVQVRYADGCAEVRLTGWPSAAQDVTFGPGLSVSGRVLDQAGKPAAGIPIFAYPVSAGLMPVAGDVRGTTEASGTFELRHLFPQRYLLSANQGSKDWSAYRVVQLPEEKQAVSLDARTHAPGYRIWQNTPQLVAEFPVSTVEVAEHADPEGWKKLPMFSARILDSRTLKPIAGYWAAAEPPNGDLVDAAAAGTDGIVVLRAPVPETIDIHGDAEGYESISRMAEFTSPPLPPIDLTVGTAPHIRLKLLTEDGKPAPAGTADVTLSVGGGSNRNKIPVAADGTAEAKWTNYDSRQLGSKLLVTVHYEGVGTASAEVTSLSTDLLTLTLKRGWPLSGQVLDEMGQPVRNTDVTLLTWNRKSDTRYGSSSVRLGDTTTDEQGRFHFTEIPAHSACSVEWGPDYNDRHRAVILMRRPNMKAVLTPYSLIRSWHRQNYGQWDLNSVEGLFMPRIHPAVGAAGGAPPVKNAAISGQVLREGTHAGRPGALVMLFERYSSAPVDAVLTDSVGRFSLKAPSGSYRIAIAEDGALVRESALKLPAVGARGMEIQAPEDGKLRLLLLSPAGAPLTAGKADAWLIIRTPTELVDGIAATASIDKTGAAVYPQTYHGPLDAVTGVQIRVRVDGVGCREVRLDGWPKVPVRVRLQAGLTAKGRVLNAAGRPAAHLTVKIVRLTPNTWGFDDQEQVPTFTDTDGRFIIRNLLPAAYRVSVGTPPPNNPNAPSPAQAGVLLPQKRELVLRAP